MAEENKPQNEFKLAEIRSDGTAILQDEQGRMFPAAIKEGLAVRKRATVRISGGELDKDGVPTGATVTSVVPTDSK